MSKTTALTPEEWKQLCLLGTVQLNSFVQQLGVPTEAHLGLIEDHIDRFKSFMRAWMLTVAADPPATAAQAAAAQAANGVDPEPVRRKGGWPKGKKRTPRVQEASVQ